MKIRTIWAGAALALAIGGLSAPANAQGRGQGKGQDRLVAGQAKGPGQAPGKAVAQEKASRPEPAQTKGRSASAPGRQSQPAADVAPGHSRVAAARGATAPGRGRGMYQRQLALNDVPTPIRRFVTSNRRPQVIAAGALARAFARGTDDKLRLVPANDRVTLVNTRGDVIVMLDEDRARNLGAWEVNPIITQVSSGAPAFCRSGAGHPVWGRQWCLDKGFGLGDFQDVRWGRTTSLADIIFNRRLALDPGRIAANTLLSFVGNTAFDRLALHAVTLGYTEPLVGTWAVDPVGPQVLLVNSGPAPVAEIIDVNRDGRADVMFVALRPW